LHDQPFTSLQRTALLGPFALVTLVLLFGPIGLLASYSLAPGGSTRADFSDGLTLENYTEVLGDWFYLGIIGNTVWLSAIITFVSILIGWPLAYFIWRIPRKWKSLATIAVLAPLLISIPVRNYGWMVILGDTGLVNMTLMRLGLIASPLPLMFTNFATVVGLAHVLMPFVVLSVLASLERIAPHLVEAAQTLGASRLRAIWTVVAPLSMPGVLAGGLLVFCVAVSAYVTPALMGPSGAKYSSTLVYQQFVSTFDWPRGAAIAMVLLMITAGVLVALLALLNRLYGHVLRGR
jgi:putative spermidine/putrescine transport system permease protein